MPRPGDQYRGIANPFDEEKPRISEWTAQEIATLQSRLDKQLGPEFISSRKGPQGRMLYYLPAEKAINLANEVFGFNGWSSSIRDTTIDFVDQSQSSGKVSLGLSVIIRVTLRDGTYHEDIGYGHIENCTGKAAAFEKAKKEAATDALKRALRTFGNVLGNCLYDKNYEAKISKMKVAPTKWNPDNLHRHADYAMKAEKPELMDTDQKPAVEQRPTRNPSLQTAVSNGTEFEDEFGGNLFEGMDFDRTDGNDDSSYESMLLENSGTKPEHAGPSHQRSQHHLARVQSMPSIRPTNGMPSGPQQRPPVNGRPVANTSMNAPPRPEGPVQRVQTPSADQHEPAKTDQAVAPPANPAQASSREDGLTPPVTSETSGPDSSNQAHHHQQGFQNAPVRFVTGRAAELLLKAEAAKRAPDQAPPAFNPHKESPSLRRTNGVDHRTSAPVKRLDIAANQTQTNGTTNGNANGTTAAALGARPNFVNPQADTNRRIGMPNAGQSPYANRQSYKPPVLKRPADVPARPALADMTNVPGDGPSDGADSKKPRVGES
ncbi:DNA recombination/repair protein Rad52 [Botryosphaeria dothidea]|uniref:RAD52 homolog n=1 Tax=Botryosphaeria dothidea TaxID=55169 RepID=A0A8H4J6W9_9PEZI|nr:DNA recombination/repair protein Rad52 [Botryosphaeria dothidea]